MGVDATAYVMYGVKFEGEEITEELDELREAMYDDDYQMVVFDGMCGQYMVLGHIFSRQDIHSDFEMVEIPVGGRGGELGAIMEEYLYQFRTKYNEWYHLIDGKEFKILAFVHYS